MTAAAGDQMALSSRCLITIDFYVDAMWTDQQIAEQVLMHTLGSVRDVVDLVRGRRR